MVAGYLVRDMEHITVARSSRRTCDVPVNIFGQAISRAHKVIDQFRTFDVDVFAILGMRNLSAFIGELYGAAVIKEAKGLFLKNPHQDGYPDLLLMDDRGQRLWKELQGRLREKTPFSPFATGGIEIKATCGSVPTPDQCKRLGIVKPDLGEERIGVMRGYDWKAHHRETNNLIGLLWDFIGGSPRIVAVFYCSALTDQDWGKIVQPREGGGRTTSVSIMSRHGVQRMYQGWLYVIRDTPYIEFIDQYNDMSLLTKAGRTV